MYEVDARDRVVELGDVPQSSVGAPLPVVVADEGTLQLAYYASVPDPDWDGSFVRAVGLSTDDPVILVQFDGAYGSTAHRTTRRSRATRSRLAVSTRMPRSASMIRLGCDVSNA